MLQSTMGMTTFVLHHPGACKLQPLFIAAAKHPCHSYEKAKSSYAGHNLPHKAHKECGAEVGEAAYLDRAQGIQCSVHSQRSSSVQWKLLYTELISP